MHIFGSIEPSSESNLPSLNINKISDTLIFGAPSSTRGGDRHKRLRTFLNKIQFQITFTWSFF